MVYILEAHASDAWQMAQNVRQNVVIASPKDAEERGAVAGACVRNLGIRIPAVVDDFRNLTEAVYTGWPDRLYVVDREGRIAYKSEAGPYGFRPAEVERALKAIMKQ